MSPTAPHEFDPYNQWLGIPRDQQPADHYRLLGLARFESDRHKIETAADERMSLVRKHQTGPRGLVTQPLLNELAAARNCLLSDDSRRAYDEKLRTSHPAPMAKVVPVQAPLEEPPIVISASADELETAPEDELQPESPTGNSLALSFLGMAAAVIAVAGITYGIGRLIMNARTQPRPQPLVSKKSDNPATSAESNPSDKPNDDRTSLPPSAGVVVMQEASRDVHLTAATAALAGNVQLTPTGGDETLSGWSAAGDSAAWRFKLQRPGFFRMELRYGATDEAGGRELTVTIDDRPAKSWTVLPTGGLESVKTQQQTVAITASGLHTLTIRLANDLMRQSLAISEVRLVPLAAADADAKCGSQ